MQRVLDVLDVVRTGDRSQRKLNFVVAREKKKGVIHISSCQLKIDLPRTEMHSVCDIAV